MEPLGGFGISTAKPSGLPKSTKLNQDPGALENGNYLCDADTPARFIVFFEDYTFGLALIVSVFSSRKVPHDITSPGICGTYNYMVE